MFTPLQAGFAYLVSLFAITEGGVRYNVATQYFPCDIGRVSAHAD
jgi:hypothetical protein